MKRPAKKRTAKTSGNTSKRTAAAAPVGATPSPKAASASRRKFLKNVRDYGLIALAVSGIGWYLIDDAMTTQVENDMSRIGNGIPTVVQIHDTQCPICTALQQEVKQALSDIDGDKLQYVVVNIRTAEGRDYANQHQVAHVTLLLLDGNGKRRGTLVGPRKSADLEQAFRQHVKAHSRSGG